MTDGDLRASLESVLGRRVQAISRLPSAYRSSFAIENLDLTFDDGRRLALVFKDLGRSALTPAAQGAKPEELLDPCREIEAYLEVLGPEGIDTAACHGAVSDPDRGRYWLFLERVDALPLWQMSDAGAWEEAAAWLADLHGRAVPRRHGHLLRYDARYFEGWIERAVAFSPRGSLDNVAAAWKGVVERLLAWPQAFVHGEFYASNVLIRDATMRRRVVPIDWEMAGFGPGLLDLAALTSGGWGPAEREQLALLYHRSLPSRLRPSADELLSALAYFRLFIAVQWLGWSQHWEPPAEHAHDWLAEARAVGRELRL